MTVATVLPRPVLVRPAATRAGDSQRVLHRLVRRELRQLAELSTWAAAGDPARAGALTRHADLLGRVLLGHHSVERELLWPALLRAVPADLAGPARDRVSDWTARCAAVDNRLRDLSTAARQWAVAGTPQARDGFALTCLDLAAAVDAQTAAEERDLLPLLEAHLPAAEWTAIVRSVRPALGPREQLTVLGLALEDAGTAERARLLAGLGPGTRLVWRLVGRSRHRATVVRLRGAPPAR